MDADCDNWIPIESDPELWNSFMGKIGLDLNSCHFEELVSLEPWAQALITGPVLAVVFLYDQSPKQVQYQKIQAEALIQTHEHQSLFYMKQYAHNACGTIAMVHSLLNNPNEVKLIPDSPLDKFRVQSLEMNPEQRGRLFEESKEIKNEHMKASQQGQSEVKEQVMEHYIAIVEKGGKIYELDGCKKSPVYHMQRQEDKTVLSCAVEVVKQIMSRDPDNSHCAINVLVQRVQ